MHLLSVQKYLHPTKPTKICGLVFQISYMACNLSYIGCNHFLAPHLISPPWGCPIPDLQLNNIYMHPGRGSSTYGYMVRPIYKISSDSNHLTHQSVYVKFPWEPTICGPVTGVVVNSLGFLKLGIWIPTYFLPRPACLCVIQYHI